MKSKRTQMKEFNVIVEIDEDGSIKAETKGMEGEVCVTELDEILEGLSGERDFKNKPEFYKKTQKLTKNINVKK